MNIYREVDFNINSGKLKNNGRLKTKIYFIGVVMARDDLAQLEGQVVDACAGASIKSSWTMMFKYRQRLCGKMQKFNIRIVVGDKVTVGVSHTTPHMCLIMYRHK